MHAAAAAAATGMCGLLSYPCGHIMSAWAFVLGDFVLGEYVLGEFVRIPSSYALPLECHDYMSVCVDE